LSLSIF